MRTRLVFGALLLVCAAATGGGPAASPASHEISIRLDPSTLAVEITDRVPGGGDLLLAPAGWVDRAEVRVGSRVVRLTSGGNAIALTADELAGEAAIVTVFGTLPEITDERGLAAGGSDGAFLLSGEGWLPVSGKNDALFEITVATPPDWRGVATGALEAETLEEGGYSARFRYEGQAEELAILFGPYEISERMHGDMRLRTYFRAEDAEHSEAYLAAVADHIDRFSEAIGAYPYDGFSVVSAPLPVGYGLPTMTYVSRRILGHPYMLGRSLAHEVLHSWWGNAVAIDYDHGNWGEGLTTYQADHGLAEARGPQVAAEMRQQWLRELSALPGDRDQPIRTFRSAAHSEGQSIGYAKVAMVFHMLRQEIGDAAFDEGIRAFWQANKNQTAGWADIEAAFGSAAIRDLDWFFGQWLDRTGLPSLTLGGVQLRETRDGYAVSFTLAQSAPAWRLRIPVEVETEDGIEQSEVLLDTTEQTLEVPVTERPLTLRVDPRFDFARRLAPGELPPTIRDLMQTEGATAVLAGSDAFAEGAQAIADRLFGAETTLIAAAAMPDDAAAVLVLGETEAVSALRDTSLPHPPREVAHEGVSRTWAERAPDGTLWVFASADDAESFAQRLRQLPYYGGSSFVVLDADGESHVGTWPVTENPLHRKLDVATE